MTVDPLRALQDRIRDTFARVQSSAPAERDALLTSLSASDPGLYLALRRLLGESQEPAFSTGDVVSNRFRIIGLLGKGGMGEVYEVEDLVLRERVALKTLPQGAAAEERAIERLKREIALARRVTHPNVCRVFDADQHQTPSGKSITFFTMELLKGQTLAERLRERGRLTTAEALPLVRQIAAALGAAHAAGVVHGDFKPGNVMLVPSAGAMDGGERLVVTDFGLAHTANPGTATAMTMTGGAGWGTPAYMAPEQSAGERITPQTDVYAMGAVVHEMVEGPAWRAAINKCLERDPAARFATPADFVRALETPEPPPAIRWPWVAAVAGAVAALLIVVLLAAPSIRTTMASRAKELAATVAEQGPSVAFLPFVDSRQTAAATAFGEGLAVVLTEQLRIASERQHLEGRLWILPAVEVIDAGVTTPAGAQRVLGANLVVAGRVDRAEDRTTIALDLEESSNQGTRAKGRDVFDVAAGGPVLSSTLSRIAKLVKLPLPRETAEAVSAGSTINPAAEELYVQGRGYLAKRGAGVDEAIDTLQRAVGLDPQFALAHAALGDAYRQKYLATRDPAFIPQAQASSDRAVALAPSVAYAHAVRGLVRQITGQRELVIRELQAALEADPGAVEAWRGLAEVYEQDGTLGKAEEIYRRQTVQYPKYWNAHEQLGAFLFRHGRYREAEASLLTGQQLAPDNTRAISNLAGLYVLTERYAAAEVELQRGLKLTPDVSFYNNLSWIYVYQGRFAEAVPPMEQAVRLPQANSFHWGNLARIYRWANRPDQAKITYDTAIRLARREIGVSPQDAKIRANLAYLLAETGHRADALAEMTGTLQNAPSDLTVVFTSALVHELTGDRSAALKALETAARGGHSVAEMRRHPDLIRLREDPGFLKVIALTAKPVLQ